MSMTPEQVELEFQHMLIDKAERGEGNSYSDDDYENYDSETDEMDNKLSDMPRFGSEASDPNKGNKPLPKPEKEQTKDEWEDVEIDDFDSEED